MSLDRGSAGELGEREVVKLVPCPNCGKKLSQLPKNHPLYDLQCTKCSFRAQVKSNNSRPKEEIFGAGWDVMDKVLKVGFLLPPLFVNFRWREGGKKRQQIVFFPFVPKTHLRRRVLSTEAKRAGYKMFNYVRLNELAQVVLYDL